MVIFVALKKITIYRKVTFEVGLLFSTQILFQTKSKYINFIRMDYDNPKLIKLVIDKTID